MNIDFVKHFCLLITIHPVSETGMVSRVRLPRPNGQDCHVRSLTQLTPLPGRPFRDFLVFIRLL